MRQSIDQILREKGQPPLTDQEFVLVTSHIDWTAATCANMIVQWRLRK